MTKLMCPVTTDDTINSEKENMSDFDILTDANALYRGYLSARKSARWKPSVQLYEWNFLEKLTELQNDLINGTYRTSPPSEFLLNERGKIRPVTGLQIRDRIVRHVLCDEILLPRITPKLIYDNAASLKGRGIDFARKRLKVHLHRYYNRYHTNDGYILLTDFSKYYDNIRHDIALNMLRQFVDDERVFAVIEHIFDTYAVDVSYMTDDEYANCMNTVHDNVKYRLENHEKTGKKYMRKSLQVGDQLAQVVGVLYPTEIDNYVKIVRGVKEYARYNDDTYSIYQTREEALDVLEGIKEHANNLGIFINLKKTHITKIDSTFRYLQNLYYLTDTGRVVERINPLAVTRARRKIKKFPHLIAEGKMSKKDKDDWFASWYGCRWRTMSNLQRAHMFELRDTLFGD